MSTFLERIIAQKRAELADLRDARDWSAVEAAVRAGPRPRDPRDIVGALASGRLGVIAEIKRASPSQGAIAPDLDATAQARRYAEGGADAISVLIDRTFYRGDVRDLEAVRRAVPTPLLAKDFFLDELGILQARACGADLALLIVAALGREMLPRLMDRTRALGMTPLVEIYTRAEAEIALEAGAALIGVNNRNLHTFEVSLETTERLAPLLAPHATVVSLSGISSADDARRVVAAGASAVLVGEALVRSADPARLIRELKSVALPSSGRPAGMQVAREGRAE